MKLFKTKIRKADDLFRTPLVDIREIDSGIVIDHKIGECLAGIRNHDNCPSANPDYFIFDTRKGYNHMKRGPQYVEESSFGDYPHPSNHDMTDTYPFDPPQEEIDTGKGGIAIKTEIEVRRLFKDLPDS